MANRPVFVPACDGPPFVAEIPVEFKWHPGMSRAQAQKSIASLHEAAASQGIVPLLEISSKSADRLGVALSAFNLMLQVPGHRSLSVECAFQGSKVFEYGGPFTDLYLAQSREAKTDARVRESGRLIGFRFFGGDFPITPSTAFYDWLYIQALVQNPELSSRLLGFGGFTDIAFNPEKSWNCQARAAAIFVALSKAGLAEDAAQSKEAYLSILAGDTATGRASEEVQLSLDLP